VLESFSHAGCRLAELFAMLEFMEVSWDWAGTAANEQARRNANRV